MNDETIGNSTTIINFLATAIAGWTIAKLASIGLNLPVSSEGLTQTIGVVLGLCFNYVNARYPNTFGFLGNAAESPETTVTDSLAIDDVDVAGEYDDQ